MSKRTHTQKTHTQKKTTTTKTQQTKKQTFAVECHVHVSNTGTAI